MWTTILTTILPLLLEFLPMIIQKPAEQRKKAFLRRAARYQRVADMVDTPAAERVAWEELADAMACCAESSEEQLQGILEAAGRANGLLTAATK